MGRPLPAVWAGLLLAAAAGGAEVPVETLFRDDFESAPEVSIHPPGTGGDVDADPVASTGTWLITDRAGDGSE